MTNISLNDAMFLLGETRDHPAHVIALQLFKPPPDANSDHLQQLYRDLLKLDETKPVFAKYPVKRRLSPTRLAWRPDPLDDIDFHLNRSALPSPGRIRELLELASAQHGVPLTRDRPLWNFRLIEGLQDGRFATFFKTHHALADGISLAHHVLGGLSVDPDARDCTPPWIEVQRPGPDPSLPPDKLPLGVRFRRAAKVGPSTARVLREMRQDATASLPYDAPRSVFNVPISGARRFAGDVWRYDRLKRVATAASCTVNDVVLAMCGSALRDYLLELGELPDDSLVAMVPVSLRGAGSAATPGEGNAFGSILCDLATDKASATERLAAITESTAGAKDRLSGRSPGEVQLMSRLIMGGALVSALTGVTRTPRQPFNLIISNVPAGSRPLYWNGAEMTEIYPLSMIMEGQALNITVTRYVDKFAFGIVGCRTAVPRLQRLLIHLEQALLDLESI